LEIGNQIYGTAQSNNNFNICFELNVVLHLNFKHAPQQGAERKLFLQGCRNLGNFCIKN